MSGIINIKKTVKILIMNLLYFFVEIFGFLKKKNKLDDIGSIGILFLPKLGMGDLIMLSPAIQKISDIFPSSKINLITWVPEIIDFKNVKIIEFGEFKKNKKDYDLIISPTFSLRHLPYIFSARYWIGYFAWPKIQSNFGATQYSYDLKNEHYLWRGIRLVKSLNKEEGERMERDVEYKSILYPNLQCQEPPYFDKTFKNSNYVAIAPFAQFGERQWPIEKFADVIKELIGQKIVNKIAILGGSSSREKYFLNILIGKLKNITDNLIVDLIGKNNLKETCFIIKNSKLYIGLDTGPSQIAYLSAPKSLSIFITVNYSNRVPLNKRSESIKCIYPLNCLNFPLDSGLVRPSIEKSRKCAQTIKSEDVLDEIKKTLQLN